MEPVRSNQPLSTTALKSIAMDYIVHDLPRGKIREKYNLSDVTYEHVLAHLDLVRKKTEYRRKLIDRAVEKMSEKQTIAMTKAIKILLRQLDHVEKIQDYMDTLPEDETDPTLKLHSKLRKLLPTDIVNDVIKTFVMITKESKANPNLDLGEMKVSKVIVEMANVPVFSRTGIVDVTPNEIPEAVEVPKVEEKKEEIKVEIDPSIGMSL